MISAVRQSLDLIREKVVCGERLTPKESESLWDDSVDLHELGELANLVRERKNGHAGYYNINTHLNPTNVCVYRCSFCAFRADLRDDRGYWMTDEQAEELKQDPRVWDVDLRPEDRGIYPKKSIAGGFIYT